MLKSIKITDRESHANTILEFHPGFNVVWGETDTGKSAIREALDWVRTNRPLRSSYISHWAEYASVLLTFPEGAVRRTKNKKGSINEYFIIGAEKPEKAIGTGVPDPVSKLINMSNINVQPQSEQPLVLSSTTELAKRITTIVGLDLVTTSISNLNKELRTSQGKIKSEEFNLEKYRTELTELPDIGKGEKLVHEAEQAEKEFRRDAKINSDLLKLVLQYQNAQEALEQMPDPKEIGSKFIEAGVAIEQIDLLGPLVSKIKTTIQIIDEIKEVKNEIIKLDKEIEDTFGDICPLCLQEIT